jgi:Spo0E like sporulation regulatory protein.
MKELDRVLEKVMDLRYQLHYIINEKGDLQNEEVLNTSRALDVLLAYYENMINLK